MAESKTRLGVSAYAISVFVFTLGSNGVRNLVGWPAFLALTVILTALSVFIFLRLKPERFRWYRLPSPLYWFMTLALLSTFWSQYRLETLLGNLAQIITTVIAIVLAYVLTWQELLRTLSSALRYLIGVSFLFELWVSVFVKQPLMPWWLEQPETTSKLLYWSRDLLFEGGPIQGIVASSVIFGFISLLALIVFAIQLRAGLVRPFVGWFWVVMASLALVLTRSATVWVALIAVAVALGFALWARRLGPEGRVPLYTTAAIVLGVAIAGVVFARDFLFGLLGKSGDLTGRVETWQKVAELASEHTWFGWGWISYWAPWVEPYKSLDVKANLAVMSAHNAWIDVWLQLGIVGVLVFAPLVLLTMWRVWFRAVDQPRRGPGPALPYATSALWPYLIMVALLVQSLTESRMLIEWGWLLLVIFAVKSRYDFELPSLEAEPKKQSWRHVPIPRESYRRQVQHGWRSGSVAQRGSASQGGTLAQPAVVAERDRARKLAAGERIIAEIGAGAASVAAAASSVAAAVKPHAGAEPEVSAQVSAEMSAEPSAEVQPDPGLESDAVFESDAVLESDPVAQPDSVVQPEPDAPTNPSSGADPRQQS